MICNHKFMAKYWGIFARFSPAWHFPGVKTKSPEKKRKTLSGVQALAVRKLVPNLRLGQSMQSDVSRNGTTILIQERKRKRI